MLSRQIRIEREFCCDDAAIAVCGDQSSYLQALATVESFRANPSNTPSYAMSLDGGGTGLTLLRARRVLGRDDRKPFKGLVGMCSILLAMTIGLAMTTMRGDATMPSDSPNSNGANPGGADQQPQQNPEQPSEKTATEAQRNDVETKIDPEDFRLDIIYNGDSDKPFYNYTFSTDMVKLERDSFWQLDQSVPQKDPKLKRMLSWLEASRFFQNLDDPTEKEEPLASRKFSSRYIMQVTSRGKVYREDLGWGLGTLIRLNSLRSVLSNGDPATPTQLDLLLGRITGFRHQWVEGWSDNDLKRRLAIEKIAIAARDPITATLTIENTGQKTRTYGRHVVSPNRYEIRVFDQYGRQVPFVGGSSQVRESQHSLDAGETATIESFDLASKNYLRRPGKYTVCYVGYSGDRSNAVEFEVTPPAKEVDDGNLVGRLLPIVEGKWDLVTDMNSHGKLRPGYNYDVVVGRQIVFQHLPTSSIRDTALIWLWFADKKTQEQTDEHSETFPPAGSYFGKIDRWHVYSHMSEKSRKRWPTFFADVKRALLAPENDQRQPSTHQGAANFEFHRDVAPSAAAITITVARTARWSEQKHVLLDATITNNSKEAITTTLAREWHGGEWPLTCLYGSVSPARATRSSFAPIYLAGEDRTAARQFTLAPQASKTVTLRMDWAGTGSVIGRPLIVDKGTYNAQLRLVFEQAKQQQFVTGVNTTVELKPMVQQPANNPEDADPDNAVNEPEEDDTANKTVQNRKTLQIGDAVIQTYKYEGEIHANIHTATDEALAEIAKRDDINVLRINADSPHGGGTKVIGNVEPPSKVTDDGLRHLAGMKSLRLLDLPMRGISDEGIKHLKDLNNLEELWLDFLPLTDACTVHLKGLTNLKVLRFFQADITDEGMKNFSNMTKLEDLQLGRALITDKSMPLIGKMTKLKTLDLRTKITNEGLAHLSGLKKLTWLCLADTEASDSAMEHIGKLKKLEWLILRNTSMTDEGLRKIEGLPKLTTLYLSATKISDAGIDSIATLKNLERVKLNKTNVTDNGLQKLVGLKQLLEVEIRDTKTTDAGIEKLQEARPELKIIK
jgi:internalin A